MSDKTIKVDVVNLHDKKSGLATASMVLGIIGIVGSLIPFVNIFSIILAIVGLGLGIPAFIILLTKKKGSMGKTIAGLILCSLTLFIAININNAAAESIDDATDEINDSLDDMSGENTDDILRDELSVVFGNYVLDDNSYLGFGSVSVTIKNIGDETSSYNIDFEALDSNNTRIATDTIFITDLGSNQSVIEEIFAYEDSDLMNTVVRYNVTKVSKY